MRAWTNWTITACCVSFLMFYACQSSYDSISSKDKLPATSEANAAGYDDENDIILIFGGASNDKQQFIQFDVQTSQFSLDPLYTPQEIRGWGQNYFQLNNTLWMLNRAGTQFVTANTHPPYDVTVPSITIPTLVDDDGCLAMTDHHIFVVGGATAVSCGVHASVQIYDMIDDTWLSGVPSLPNNRMRMACYAVDDTLYAIGGNFNGCSSFYDSILTLDISPAALSDISSQTWQVSSSKLNTKSSQLKVVKHRNDLIVIGGQDGVPTVIKDVNVINTLTGECVLAGTLSLGTLAPAVIVHESTNTLYIFGGFTDTSETDRWQFINLPTVDPTAHPTPIPTGSPTRLPTSEPTPGPTANPTQTPSFEPSLQPSSDPSVQPSSDPSVQPSSDPSVQPSPDPSLPPTNILTAPTIKLNANGAAVSPLRDTTASPTTVTIAIDTAGGAGEHTTSEFVMDDLAIILVVVCGSLCLIIVVVVIIIYGQLKKGEKERMLDIIANDRKQQVVGVPYPVGVEKRADKEDSIEKLYINQQAADTGTTTTGHGTATAGNDEDSIEKLYMNKNVVETSTGATTTGNVDKNQVEMSHTVEGDQNGIVMMALTVEGGDVPRNEVTGATKSDI